jgi:hypothetical protein
MWLLGAAVLVITAGIVGGIVASKKAGSSSSSSSSTDAAEKICSTDSLTTVTEFKQLPSPDSAGARALAQDPSTPGRTFVLSCDMESPASAYAADLRSVS